jgi:hypothetical protein
VRCSRTGTNSGTKFSKVRETRALPAAELN